MDSKYGPYISTYSILPVRGKREHAGKGMGAEAGSAMRGGVADRRASPPAGTVLHEIFEIRYSKVPI